MGKRSVEKERFWRKMIAKQAKAGGTVRDFCAEHELNENQFYSWKRELRLRQREAVPEKRQAPLIPLELVGNGAADKSALEIVIADPPRVRVSPGFDPATLAEVLAVLEKRTC